MRSSSTVSECAGCEDGMELEPGMEATAPTASVMDIGKARRISQGGNHGTCSGMQGLWQGRALEAADGSSRACRGYGGSGGLELCAYALPVCLAGGEFAMCTSTV